MERCLCIKAPLHVRRILTPKRTAISLAAIFFLLLLTMLPIFVFTDLGPISDPRTNKTLIGIVLNDYEDAWKPVFLVSGFAVTTGSFLSVFIFSAILVHALIQRRQKWKGSKNRSTSQTRPGSKTATPNKDVQVAKMILLVAAVFLLCYFPLCSLLLSMEFVPKFYMGKAYNNLYLVCMAFTQNLQSVNGSVNILLYIKMSSKYRRTIGALFLSQKQTEPNLD
ncbi:uncharacterized protein LOC101851098 [Aplysia californica]|uniref:Uncharacterized protein LOC101851098 n=1 Tax=Aplysia californica TaxID=6500 RepID=A0ABM0KAP2_APLCA|nr:uncharacterized protein LOC101851098 [Aplysia californica]